MLSKIIPSSVLALSLLIPSTSFAQQAEKQNVDLEKVVLSVDLSEESFTVENLDSLAIDAAIKEFQAVSIEGDDTVTYGYILGIEQTLSSAEKDFETVTAQELPEGKNPSELKLEKVTIHGNEKKIRDKFKNKKVKVEKTKESENINAHKLRPSINSLLAATPTYINKGRTTPYKGDFSINSGSTGNFINQTFVFSSYGLTGYEMDGMENSFELDTIFYNYDGYAWATKYGGSTQGTWWNTNLPAPYMDTQFGDDWSLYGGEQNAYGEASESVFSIGTANAEGLASEKPYYYTIKVYKNSRPDNWKLKLTAQPGKAYFGNEWGVFSYETWRMYPYDPAYWATFKENTRYTWTRQ